MMAGVTDKDEDRGAEGVEHLQAAARELLAAARSFLSVVEDVVEDPDRLAGAASGVADLLRSGLAAAVPPPAPMEPWERAAWHVPDTDVDLGEDIEVDLHVDPGPDPGPGGDADAPGDAVTGIIGDTQGRRRRVRRIAVD